MAAEVNGDVPTPVDIGREFVRQYYTLLSEKPEDAYRFYSNDSMFNFNDVTAVGQQKIQKAIEEIGFTSSKVRVFSIKGQASLHNGIVLHVTGDMTLPGQNNRRFSHTFVLGQQNVKKFYVHNDIFTFLDKVFETQSSTSSSTPSVASPPQPTKPTVNGHPEVKAAPAPEQAPPAPVKREEPKVQQAPPPVKKEQPAPVRQQQPAVEKKAEPVPSEPAPAAQPAPVDNRPKTWANLVGGTKAVPSAPSAQPTLAPAPAAQPQHPAPSANTFQTQSRQQSNDVRFNNNNVEQGNRKIYMGYIVRNAIPEHTGIAESEIRQLIQKFGDVESVGIPRRVLENPEDAARTAYAFITMRTPQDAAKVFAACRSDRNLFFLPLKIESFKFDGEVQLSEQKAERSGPPTGFRGGRGGNFGGPRGGFGPRGGSQGFRGGFRGGHGGAHPASGPQQH